MISLLLARRALANLNCRRHLLPSTMTAATAPPVGDTTLPRPTGPHTVGYTDVEFESRCGRTVLCRLHYPTTTTINYTRDNRGMWLPSEQYHPGYGYYLRIPTWLSGALFKYIAGHVQMWAVRDAPAESIVEARGVVVLSHGLGGIRTTYSTLCCELVSHGYVVAAVEHRDGSASITVDAKGRAVPYLFPHEHNEFNFRNMQLGQRVEEVRAVIEYLRGDFAKTVFEGVADIHKHLLVDRNTEIYGMGHSMGAATMLKAADLFTAVVALDPWTFPLAANHPPISTPCLIISLENFDWPNNESRLLSLMHEQPARRFLKILKADHADQSDVPVVMPEVIRWRMRTRGSVEPERVIGMTGEFVKEFLATRTVGGIDEAAVRIVR